MSASQAMVTMQERMVSLVGQLSMPVIETSLVIGRWTNKMTERLVQIAAENDEVLPGNLIKPWPLDVTPVESDINFELEKALSIVDKDRMEIVDTLISVTIEEFQIPMAEALLFLRTWEKLVREQLSQATGPGQLFSPTELPDDF